MADKEGMERKVYLLPKELVDRIQAFQQDQNISSEVEAARRLLDSALQMRDTLDDIFKKLRARFNEERDLRVLARDILWNHQLVTGVTFGDRDVSFNFKGGDSGRIDHQGRLYISPEHASYDEWHEYTLPSERKPAPQPPKKTTGWDAKPDIDLDDEIPF